MDTTASLTDSVRQLFNTTLDPYEWVYLIVGGIVVVAVCLLVIALIMAGIYVFLVGVKYAIDRSDALQEQKDAVFDSGSNELSDLFDGSTAAVASADSEAL